MIFVSLSTNDKEQTEKRDSHSQAPLFFLYWNWVLDIKWQ